MNNKYVYCKYMLGLVYSMLNICYSILNMGIATLGYL